MQNSTMVERLHEFKLITECLRAKCTKQLCSGEDIYLGFCKYKRSYVFLRNPIFCLSNQFSLNLFLMRSQTDFIKAGTYFTQLSAHFMLILRFPSKKKYCNINHLILHFVLILRFPSKKKICKL